MPQITQMPARIAAQTGLRRIAARRIAASRIAARRIALNVAHQIQRCALVAAPLVSRVHGADASLVALLWHILSGIMPRLSQQVPGAARVRTAFLCILRVLEKTDGVTCIGYIAYAALLACIAEFICAILGYHPPGQG